MKEKLHLSISILAPAVYLVFALTDGLLPLCLLICSAALHECGHLAAMRIFGVPVEKIKILPFGVTVKIKEGYLFRYRDELFCALSGPFSSLIGAIIATCAMRIFSVDLRLFLLINLFLFTLNILPIMPLDGGRALNCLFLMKLPLDTAGKLSDLISFLTLIPVMVAGVLLLRLSGYNFSLLLIAIYLTITLLLKNIKLKR